MTIDFGIKEGCAIYLIPALRIVKINDYYMLEFNFIKIYLIIQICIQ